MSFPKPPKIPGPGAPAPVAPRIEPPSRELGGDERSEPVKKKRGRASLRIDTQSIGMNSKGGAGINVPMK